MATNCGVVLRMYPLPDLKGFFFEFQCFVMPAQLPIQITKIIKSTACATIIYLAKS